MPSPNWQNDAIYSQKRSSSWKHTSWERPVWVTTLANYTSHGTRFLDANVDEGYWHIKFLNTFFIKKIRETQCKVERFLLFYSNFSWAFHYHRCNIKNLLLISRKSVCVYNEWTSRKNHLFKTIRENVSKFSLIH